MTEFRLNGDWRNGREEKIVSKLNIQLNIRTER